MRVLQPGKLKVRLTSRLLGTAAVMILAAGRLTAGPHPLVEFDFTRPEVAREWGAPHHIDALTTTPAGLEIQSTGEDPYFFGPPRNYPSGQALWLLIRIRSEQGGSAQIFYFDSTQGTSEEQSGRFDVPAGDWAEARVMLPPLGPQHRLRIDPPGTGGKTVISSIRILPRREFSMPRQSWTRPAPGNRRVLSSGDIELFAGARSPYAVEIRINGRSMAFGHSDYRVGCFKGEELTWLEWPACRARAGQSDGGWVVSARAHDADGVEWSLRQEFRPGPAGSIEVQVTVEASDDREAAYLPLLLLSAGEGSFGTNKNQGLFAGVEYLENEPGSSEADIIGRESLRQVPSTHKLTMPLMAVQAGGQYVGLVWDRHLEFSAVFDSPDRLFGSGGHALGVLWPGSDGLNRVEGSLLPLAGQVLRKGRPVILKAFIIGGKGDSVVPAVQHYVNLKGLPALPDTGCDARAYARLAARGWLKSKCQERGLYRHAVWQGFGPQPAADAGLHQCYLAHFVQDAPLAEDLRAAADQAVAAVNPSEYLHSGVGHVRTPAVSLVFGHVAESVATARNTARKSLSHFTDSGVVPYQKPADGQDYGRTHWTNHANGITGRVVAGLLEAAAFCGDEQLLAQALHRLRGLNVYHRGVPRGAQTWEMPLHTPDILAAAHMVNAYVTGFELTGEAQFREEAIYWAWTGVPMIYLVDPTPKPVGRYSTVSVLGATHWRAPVWFGQPVQWCGLVYAHALYRLAQIDQPGPWRHLADGITAAGIQHTWKADDANRAGLLPDYYLLKAQRGDGPAINPATVGINAARLYGQPALYSFRRARAFGVNIHAPGDIQLAADNDRSARFTVRGWSDRSYWVLLSGCASIPRVRLDGREVTPGPPHEQDSSAGWIALRVSGNPEIVLTRGRRTGCLTEELKQDSTSGLRTVGSPGGSPAIQRLASSSNQERTAER